MERVAFVGCSGAGKTTLARAVAARLGLAHIELDAVFHQPGWQELPVEEFRRRVAERIHAAPGGWTCDGNYNTMIGDIVQGAADTIVWVDPPKRVVMNQVVRRTLRRVATREELWNGNREPWTNLYARDPEKNIIVWTWTHFDGYRERYSANVVDGTWGHAEVVHLQSRADADAWLASVGGSVSG